MSAHQKGSIQIHETRDERYAPHVLYMCIVYVIICDVLAIIDRIRDWEVSDREETGRTAETAFVVSSELISRVEACVADDRPVVCAYVCPWKSSHHLAITPV